MSQALYVHQELLNKKVALERVALDIDGYMAGIVTSSISEEMRTNLRITLDVSSKLCTRV